MNTNTIKQAERLKELGIRADYINLDAFQLIKSGWWSDNLGAGPFLTRDEWHMVFEWLADQKNINIEFGSKGSWFLVALDDGDYDWGKDFPRTNNHAEDWTEILIWLLENKHVTPGQVNEALQ